jgi:hypothetical protein
LTIHTRVGSLTVLTHERGNKDRLSNLFRNNTNHYQVFVTNTTFYGWHIQNAFVPKNDGKQALLFFIRRPGD